MSHVDLPPYGTPDYWRAVRQLVNRMKVDVDRLWGAMAAVPQWGMPMGGGKAEMLPEPATCASISTISIELPSAFSSTLTVRTGLGTQTGTMSGIADPGVYKLLRANIATSNPRLVASGGVTDDPEFGPRKCDGLDSEADRLNHTWYVGTPYPGATGLPSVTYGAGSSYSAAQGLFFCDDNTFTFSIAMEYNRNVQGFLWKWCGSLVLDEWIDSSPVYYNTAKYGAATALVAASWTGPAVIRARFNS